MVAGRRTPQKRRLIKCTAYRYPMPQEELNHQLEANPACMSLSIANLFQCFCVWICLAAVACAKLARSLMQEPHFREWRDFSVLDEEVRDLQLLERIGGVRPDRKKRTLGDLVQQCADMIIPPLGVWLCGLQRFLISSPTANRQKDFFYDTTLIPTLESLLAVPAKAIRAEPHKPRQKFFEKFYSEMQYVNSKF